MMVTLDGFYEGVDHDISWHNTDTEFTDFANEQLDTIDTIIFGRKTYEMMAKFWPTQLALKEEPETANIMNNLSKVVFSHEEFGAEWDNTVVSTNLVETVKELKSQKGKEIAVMGSSHLGKDMIEAELIDEIRIMVNPLLIGDGSTLFEGLSKKLRLKSTRAFTNGNVLLVYTT